MQHWSPTVIHPSKLIKTFSPTKSRSSTNVFHEDLVGMFWKMFEPIESRKSFASLLFIKGVTEPLIGVLKKYDVTIVKKIIDHPTTTVPGHEDIDLTFAGFVDKRRVKLCFVNSFVLLHRETGRASNTTFFHVLSCRLRPFNIVFTNCRYRHSSFKWASFLYTYH